MRARGAMEPYHHAKIFWEPRKPTRLAADRVAANRLFGWRSGSGGS
jgi:hypothetical protein